MSNRMQLETLRSIYLRLFRGGQALGVHGATGFLVGSPARPILVSARHVFTACDNDTGQPLVAEGAPDKLFASLPIGANADGSVVFHDVEVPLCTRDAFDRDHYDWWDHPKHGCRADVAAVSFPKPVDKCLITPLVSTLPFVQTPPEAQLFPPTTPVSVIGFPFGRTGPQSTAIWTTCSVASEYGTEEDLFIYVDGRTRAGQSGSPVVKYRADGNLSPYGGIISNGGPASHFAGLYSGRINADSDIGKVWKPSVIKGLLTHGAASA